MVIEAPKNMPRKASAPPTPIGEVIMVNKPAPPAPKPVKPPKEKPAPPPPPPEPLIKEVSPSKYENELRPKKELSEKQKANLAKLIERNKAKAVERRATISEAIPEVIPEDKILIRIKPKRVYNRKPKEEPKNEVIEPTPEPTPAPSESEYSESEPEVKPRKPRKRAVKPPPQKKVAPRYAYDTETTTADEDSSDSDEDDYKVQKYQAKAEKRLKAIEKIDRRMKALQNPYAERSLSVF
jgi:hypothetical protein